MQANNTKKKSSGSNMLVRMFLTPEIGMLIPIIILCVVTGLINNTFFTWKYFSSILKGSIFIGAATLGQALVTICGEVDLSLGMNGCLAGIMMSWACDRWGFGLIPCLLVCLASGALVGLVNGFCTSKLKLSSWITTLATQFICKGLAVTISQGEPISIKPLGTTTFTRAKPLGLNYLFFIFIALIIIFDLIVRRTKFGYKLRAVGGNANAATMAGISVARIRIIVFVLAGMLAAIGGMFDVLNKATASSTYGDGREFRTIICVNMGGLSAGNGSIYGAAVGILLFHVVQGSLSLLGFDKNLQLVLIGLILLLAVVMDIQRKRYEARQVAK